MSRYIMYVVVMLLLIISYSRDKNKTKAALKKAWKSFENILPQFSGVIILVGILLAVFDADLISRFIGKESGWFGIIFSAVIGAITLIPAIVAFPAAALLLSKGAGYMQLGAFISALMMVGVVTAPVEIKYFGKRLTLLRNLSAFIFCFFVAYVIGKVVGG